MDQKTYSFVMIFFRLLALAFSSAKSIPIGKDLYLKILSPEEAHREVFFGSLSCAGPCPEVTKELWRSFFCPVCYGEALFGQKEASL